MPSWLKQGQKIAIKNIQGGGWMDKKTPTEIGSHIPRKKRQFMMTSAGMAAQALTENVCQ